MIVIMWDVLVILSSFVCLDNRPFVELIAVFSVGPQGRRKVIYIHSGYDQERTAWESSEEQTDR
jgi:hypothetical protein